MIWYSQTSILFKDRRTDGRTDRRTNRQTDARIYKPSCVTSEDETARVQARLFSSEPREDERRSSLLKLNFQPLSREQQVVQKGANCQIHNPKVVQNYFFSLRVFDASAHFQKKLWPLVGLSVGFIIKFLAHPNLFLYFFPSFFFALFFSSSSSYIFFLFSLNECTTLRTNTRILFVSKAIWYFEELKLVLCFFSFPVLKFFSISRQALHPTRLGSPTVLVRIHMAKTSYFKVENQKKHISSIQLTSYRQCRQ